jgi:hypothetical protein
LSRNLTPPESILCVDCGGTCHLLSRPFEDEDGGIGFQAGDIVSYRCSDCLDRWDIELEEGGPEDPGAQGSAAP